MRLVRESVIMLFPLLDGPIVLAQEGLPWSVWFVLIAVVLVAAGLVLLMVAAMYGNLWLQAFMARADISILSLIGMGFRQVNPRLMVKAKIMASKDLYHEIVGTIDTDVKYEDRRLQMAAAVWKKMKRPF